MTDVERIILDELSEVKQDTKRLLVDVGKLKIKTGLIGASAGVVATAILNAIIILL